MDKLPVEVLRQIVGNAPEGIAVCDARGTDQPVVFVNAAFERMTGYTSAELLGKNLRLLQGADRDQEARRRLREAVAKGESCRALIRNQRKDGSPLWNEIQLVPVRDAAGVVTHVIGFHRDAGDRARSPDRPLEGLPSWMREDRLTGLASRPWFEELLLREWASARREGRRLSVLLFDIDGLRSYNETFDRAAGDSCIRQVARTIGSSYRRGVDVTGRWENGCIAVMVGKGEARAVADYAGVVAQRVADLRIHHPRAAVQKFITVTTGVAGCTPGGSDIDVRALLLAAENALREAKRDGRAGVRAVDVEEPIVAAAQGEGGGETTAMTPKAG
jgi:diguanylate cyclase (GGDEF)-like protein/PAS domain S-box-containing protein